MPAPFQNISRSAIRSGFVRAFRVAFSSNLDYQYRTHENDPNQPADDSKVFIYDSWPWTNVKYPSVIVTLGPGDPLMRTMGGDFQSDESTAFGSTVDGLTHNNVDAEVYGGGISTTVRVMVFARSAIERSQITDWIQMYVRHFFVDQFQREGVSIARMTQGTENQVLVGNDPVYTDSLDVSVYSEFQHTIPAGANGTIDAICLTHIFSMTFDGTTT